ncbi:UDP-N-acetylglucosamine 4,6-dehydratase family protein [Clostridium sp. ZS2-4]|uniref:UDP-N-acetylglucosamine 4,6-dehydratase family protein n=1 Tax=Clostridium sp. ZS2-4 TaxID=2987703 RepID=UPI00227C3010|nr:UDP-N-acetylglucosamine 4,6-dehydratase family protein [Clostridium sp. ZS2-4]MCY6353974.1 polysaccharide biosynthesis protein [Clostridium sp. ZS2-4]
MSYFTDKSILIIGGTGTIGNGLVKELIKHNPKVIRIFSRDEYKQFLMQQEYPNSGMFRFLIGDVRDYDRVERAMNNIDIVFNLAAMKHVPACEYNPTEAIKTNVVGMENVIKAAQYHNVECVLFTSSDKAINPTNSYGATKLLAEKLVQAASYSKGKTRTKFVAVRFGNVMGSRGSVIPLFKKQIIENRKITVTDPSMTRFMMTLDQAVNLIMHAVENSVGGELFILKMPVVKLKDLAEVIIKNTANNFNISSKDIKIENIGLRAGERMYEELMTEEESINAYDLGDMYAVLPTAFYTGVHDYYKNKKKAKQGSYNSMHIKQVFKEEIERMLIAQNLI